jgi:hypothetical protein
MRSIVAAVVAAGLCLLAGVSIAQQARTATISFTKPVQYVDGTAIAASTVVTYNVYQGAKGATKTKVATITGTATTINTGLQPGETCWQVTAVANGVESALSNEGCKTFAWPATEAVTITVT